MVFLVTGSLLVFVVFVLAAQGEFRLRDATGMGTYSTVVAEFSSRRQQDLAMGTEAGLEGS